MLAIKHLQTATIGYSHEASNKTMRMSLQYTLLIFPTLFLGLFSHVYGAPDYTHDRQEQHFFPQEFAPRIGAFGGTNADKSASVGAFKLLVVPVEFSDVKFGDYLEGTGAADTSNMQYWRELFFGDGEGELYPHPSMATYYHDQSYGQFEINGEVVEPISLANSLEHYGTLNGGTHGGVTSSRISSSSWGITALIKEVLLELEVRNIDVTQYVNNDSGRIDGLVILHVGPGGQNVPEDENSEFHIWSHVTDRTFRVGSSDRLVRYMAVAETFYLNYEKRHVPSSIGVFAHEFGHILGLIDLYDVPTNNAQGVGHYSIMGHGLYDLNRVPSDSIWGPDVRPKSFDPHSKLELGWIVPERFEENNCFFGMNPSSHTEPTFLRTDFTATEYALLEYRVNQSWDAELPNSGVLAWRIDEEQGKWNSSCVPSPANSCAGLHPTVSVLQADGLWELDSSELASFMDERDYYTTGDVLSPDTNPPLAGWQGDHDGSEFRIVGPEQDRYVLHAVVDPGALAPEPFLGGTPSIPGAIGEEFVWTPVLSPQDATARFQLLDAPAGTQFDAQTGSIRWTAQTPGQHVTTLQVITCSGSDRRTISVVIPDEESAGCNSNSSASAVWLYCLILLVGIGRWRYRLETTKAK